MPTRSILWFRKDLRLHDNPVLYRALQKSDAILPVYCIDPDWFRELPLGFRKMGIKRAAFLLQSLEDLRQNLQSIGGDLQVVVGRAAAVLPELVRQYGIQAVYAQRDIPWEERQEEAAVQHAIAPLGCEFERDWSHLLYHPEDLSFEPEETAATFKTFRKQLRRSGKVRQLLPEPVAFPLLEEAEYGAMPKLSELGFAQTASPAYAGGEQAALERLQYYFFDSELLTRYKWTRNQSLGDDYSSKFSPYLALGCLSPRRVYWENKRYEAAVKKNISTYWLIFELKWREFFQYLGMKHGNRMFLPGGIKGRKQDWKEEPPLFDKWRKAETGIPFLDAHMRQMNQTGFMSNRGRVNHASFLAQEYGINWTWGAAWFESQLIDYDVCSNWLNWNTQATEQRFTNPIWQNKKYDKKGEFVRHWLPELSELPAPQIYAPFSMSEEEQAEHRLRIGQDYPAPATLSGKLEWAVKRL
jgi:deoxyribodipyrimidine photo-lyase